MLGWLGSKPPEGWYVIVSQIATAYYFVHFLVILPLLGFIERPLPLPNSIIDFVIGKAGAGIPAGAHAEPATKG